jgi:hypothetical protein
MLPRAFASSFPSSFFSTHSTSLHRTHREKAYFKEVIKTIGENGGDPVDKDELATLRVQIGGTAASIRVCGPKEGERK